MNTKSLSAYTRNGVSTPMIRILGFRLLNSNNNRRNIFPWRNYYGLLFRHAIWLGDFNKEIRRSTLTVCFHSYSPLLRAWHLFLEYDSFRVTSAGQPIVPWNEYSCRERPYVNEQHETSGIAC
jgi:hypothetical protein